MKVGFRQLKIYIVLILVAIVVGQGIWVYNMYKIYYIQFFAIVSQSIKAAILKDVSSRHEQTGGWISYAPLTIPTDTSRYVTKTIQSADTSFQVTYDRYDPNSQTKLIQFLLKDNQPVKVNSLDSIFRQELIDYRFPLAETAIEYLDLKSNKVLDRSDNKSASKTGWLSTDVIPLDIFNTIGIRAYAQVPALSVLQQMAFQLVLSFILISICMFFLFVVIRSFFWKEKVELMRQDSVNAMTHEFKRPISGAVAQASLIPYYLEKGNLARVQQYAEFILLELNKLTSYTERIQKLSNNTKETLFLDKKPIHINEFFSSMTEKYRQYDEKKVTISCAVLTSRQYIDADLVHFSNIVENLVENAIKYSDERVTVTITVIDVKDRLKISIKDDGFGIAEKDLPRIFDRFYRGGQKDVQRKVGFGLGLTYVKALTGAHGGEIKVESKLGTGTEFILYFPAENDA